MDASAPGVVETDIPARLDALPWTRFHTLGVVALGITWILDRLEVTLAGAVSGALKASPTLHMTEPQLGIAGRRSLEHPALPVCYVDECQPGTSL